MAREKVGSIYYIIYSVKEVYIIYMAESLQGSTSVHKANH